MKILICEDSLETALTFKKLFEQNGFHVTCSDNAEEAIKLWNNNKYDLLLSDVNLSRMSGFDFAERVRAKDDTIPFILYTKSDDPFGDLERLASSGKYKVTKFISNYSIQQTLKEVRERLNKAYDVHEERAKILSV